MAKKKSSPSRGRQPVNLTQADRDLLTRWTRSLQPAARRKLEAAGEGTQAIPFTRKELSHLLDIIDQEQTLATPEIRKRLTAIASKVADAAEAADIEQIEVLPSLPDGIPTDPDDLIFQFKITLIGIEPPIWRRIQVPDYHLLHFHDCIQRAMGWQDDHLHQFKIRGECYAPTDPEGVPVDEGRDEADVMLSELLPRTKRAARWLYMYDFGDDWRHEVDFEGFLLPEPGADYPRCIGGARACPPEDCGGIWGYDCLVDAISAPANERDGELIKWYGDFDPEKFDPTQPMEWGDDDDPENQEEED